MSTQKQNRVHLCALIIITLISTSSLADNRLNLNGGDGTQGFEFPIVRSDADIKKMGLTREQFNKQNPAAESQWRRAWSAKGTKQDMSTFQIVRRNTTAPTDASKGP